MKYTGIGLSLMLAGLLSCTKDFTSKYEQETPAEPVLLMLLQAGEVPVCTLSRTQSVVDIPDTSSENGAEVYLLRNGSAPQPMLPIGEGQYRAETQPPLLAGDRIGLIAYLPSGDTLKVEAVEVPFALDSMLIAERPRAGQDTRREVDLSWVQASPYYELSTQFWYDSALSNGDRLYVDTSDPEATSRCQTCEFRRKGNRHFLTLYQDIRIFHVPTQRLQVADSMTIALRTLSEGLYRYLTQSSSLGNLERIFLYPENPFSNVQGGHGIVGAYRDTVFTVDFGD